MISILFVDDNAAILRALERLLMRDRARWRMVFACGATQALDILREDQFDVVVSDLRMPVLDGRDLLARVRDLQPRAARVVLSGSVSQDEYVRAAAIADEMLCKPCMAGPLRDCLERQIRRIGAAA